jgi:uncharacterized protein (TIGR03437 family)
MRLACAALMVVVAANAPGQSASYPYVLQTFAGAYPLGDGGPASAALLFAPSAVALDGSGNLFVLDAGNYRVRKVGSDGTITTAVQLAVEAYDLKVGRDGSFYLTAEAMVFKVTPGGASPYGQVTAIAGNGTAGTSSDGIPAVSASLSADTGGIAVDSAGNVYFVDGNRVREVTTDGLIHTVAGTTGPGGYNGDNQTAVTAQLNSPWGLAVDAANNLYIADQYNSRVRKVSSGNITTIAGNGSLGAAVNGPATASPLGTPYGLTVDGSGNVYITDIGLFWAIKIGADGNLTHVAGNGSGLSDFGYSDGPATTNYIYYPAGAAVDGSGNLYIAELDGNRVRKVSAGNLQTVAGRLHFAGDNGPAAAALLNQPQDMALDPKGNVFIADYANYRVRGVVPNGTIATIAGNGIPDTPDDGATAASAPLPDVWAIATDVSSNVYLATTHKVLQVTPAGVVTTVAGTGAFGDTGDGSAANTASFKFITGVAVDGAGNVYIADSEADRVRKVSAADGSISAFAGTGTSGYFGDRELAVNAKLNLCYQEPAPLAVDAQGSVYIGDCDNYVVRKVDASGTINTVAGYGAFGSPVDGQQATSSPLSQPSGISVDASENLYIVSQLFNAIYRVDATGMIQHISGGGTAAPADGVPATLSTGFGGVGIKVDSNKDLYVADPTDMTVRKLVYNSPTGLSITSGNNQSGPAGSTLPAPLTVTVHGRAGAGVAGAAVNFSVTSGAATVSALTVTADANGTAQAAVTFGQAAGSVIISASIAGTNLTPVSFTLFATAPNPNCLISPPSITSVGSLSDYGGLPSFASGSWLEVRGSNLAIDTRSWNNSDFNSGVAPTSLDGTSVTINNIAGFVGSISPQQVNVVAPADPFTGQVQITAANCAGTSTAVSIQKNAIAPGLLAPGSFNVNGKQYLAAQLPGGQTYVGSPGYAPASPGNSLSTFGVGFGPVNPAIPAGVAATGATSIAGLTISFGATPAAVSYAGMAPGAIGLYQFNFTVPNVTSGDYQIVVNVGGTPMQQMVYLTVQQ